jgi:hypothetical protein
MKFIWSFDLIKIIGVSAKSFFCWLIFFYEILSWREERKLKKEASREEKEENIFLVHLTLIFGLS